jgi:hypothetical protein
MVALIALGCGAKEPPVAHPEPSTASPPTTIQEPPASVVAMVDAGSEPAPDAATAPRPEGPPADNPGFADVANVGNEKLPDGFYFVDGRVTEVPCAACPDARLVIEDRSQTATFDFEDRLALPKLRKGQRVRVVYEKRTSRRLFVRQSKPCPISECLETDPPMKLELAPRGAAVRRDGDRCYAVLGCAPNAKCDPDRESRVRCP